MSPPLSPAKWNAKAVIRLIAGACARAGVASSPAITERKVLRSVNMTRLPLKSSVAFAWTIAEIGDGFYVGFRERMLLRLRLLRSDSGPMQLGLGHRVRPPASPMISLSEIRAALSRR